MNTLDHMIIIGALAFGFLFFGICMNYLGKYASHVVSETNSHPSIKRNKIEARGDASPNHDVNVATGEGGKDE